MHIYLYEIKFKGFDGKEYLGSLLSEIRPENATLNLITSEFEKFNSGAEKVESFKFKREVSKQVA